MRNKKLFIFGALAVLGVFGTAAAGVWAGYKSAKKISEVKPKGKLATVKACGKYYIPLGIALGLTVISDAAVYKIGMAEFTALTGTIGYLTLNKDLLEKELKKAVGEEKFKEIKKEINKEIDTQVVKRADGVLDIQETGYGDTLCRLDCDFCKVWFRSSPEEVQKAIDEIETRWQMGEYIGFTEILDSFHVKIKDSLHWLLEEYGYPHASPGCCPEFNENSHISIDTDIVEGYVPGLPEETLLIDILTPPVACYLEY